MYVLVSASQTTLSQIRFIEHIISLSFFLHPGKNFGIYFVFCPPLNESLSLTPPGIGTSLSDAEKRTHTITSTAAAYNKSPLLSFSSFSFFISFCPIFSVAFI